MSILSIAPMLDWTDRHCRYFYRLLTRRTLLYTEMVAAPAILHGKSDYLLQYNPEEHPLALQLGGSDPDDLAECAKIGADFGYDEINLNVGCPSSRVQAGQFGACLMLQPELVAECVAAMQNVVAVPITIKTRLGLHGLNDSHDETLSDFVSLVADAGCKKVIVHARHAHLNSLSPKQNRTIPPLDYASVYKVKQDFPELTIVINGGIKTVEQIHEHLKHVDGVMIGREAYVNPYLLARFDQDFYGEVAEPKSREQVLDVFIPYIKQQIEQGVKLTAITRHIMGLYHGTPGARKWRRELSEDPKAVFNRSISS